MITKKTVTILSIEEINNKAFNQRYVDPAFKTLERALSVKMMVTARGYIQAMFDEPEHYHQATFTGDEIKEVIGAISELMIALAERENIVTPIAVPIAVSKLTQAAGKKANAGRVKKFSTLKEELKEYWIENIDPSMGNNKAAKKLIETAIYTQSVTKPELGTVAGYVGTWKK